MNFIKNSILFGYAQKIASTLDTIFPPETKRGEFLRLVRSAIHTSQNEGSKVLVSMGKEKIQKQLIPQKIKQSIGIRKTPKPQLDYDIKTLKDSEIIQNDGFREVDQSLRNFIKIGSSDIPNLPRYPKISLIIPTYNQVGYLDKALKSIDTKTTYKNFEIILVTNNLDENSEMRKYLKSVKYPVYLFTETYSYAAIVNFAATKAAGEFILILNDDIEIDNPNWIQALLKLALDDKVAVVGGKLLYPDGKLQEAGCIIWKNGTGWNYGRNDDPNNSDYNFVREVDYISGCFLMIKKQIFEDVGCFDLRYEVGYCEDPDLCFSIYQKGYKILYQPLATIIHYEGKTCGTDGLSGMKAYQVINQKKLAQKWKSFLDNRNMDSSENALIERNRKKGANILYIDHYIPEYDKDSGSLDAFYILSILSALDHKVTFWPENHQKTEPYATELQQKGIEVMYNQRNFESFLKERGWLYHICFISRPYTARKHIDLLRKHTPQCKIVYNTVDLHFLQKSREAQLKKDQSMLRKSKELKKTEMEIIRKSDIVIAISELEAKLIQKEEPSKRIAVIPPFRIADDKTIPFEERKDMLFLGGFQHPPNVDSLEYLIEDILPKIKKELPGVILYVIGSNTNQKIIELCSKNTDVVLLGHIQDLDSYLRKVRMLLAPLRFGAGVKGKIIQSLAYGLPVVTTSIGSEGISNEDSDILNIANKEEIFAEKAIALYENKDLWTKMSINGKKYAETHFSPELARETLKEIIAICLNQTK